MGDSFKALGLLRRDTTFSEQLTNAIEITLKAFSVIPPLLLRPVCRALATPPGTRLLRLPPALLLIPPRLHEQGPLGIRHRELRHGKRLKLDAVDRRFVLVEPFVAAEVIR